MNWPGVTGLMESKVGSTEPNGHDGKAPSVSLPELLRRQFELERHYHFRLLAETDYERRKALYAEAYTEGAAGMVQITGNVESRGFTDILVTYVLPFIRDKLVADIGCGYGKSTRAFSKLARHVIGVEVSRVHVNEAERQARAAGCRNIQYRQGWATETGLAAESVDVFYSNDLVEHLHPDDFDRYLDEGARVLRPGGTLILVTANSLFGPHDISKYFLPRGARAEGLHLFEPTYADVARLLPAHGFAQVRAAAMPVGLCRWLPLKALTTQIWLPIGLKVALERVSLVRRCRPLAKLLALHVMFVVARKPVASAGAHGSRKRGVSGQQL